MRFIAGLIIFGIALLSLAVQSARATPPEGLQVSMQGDAELDCAKIVAEVGSMDDLISQTYQTQEASEKASVGVGVIKTVGSYLVGTLTGTIGFMAAGQLAAQAAGSRGEDAEAVGDIALQRRSLMVGMYQAKKCAGALPEPPPPPEKLWPSLHTPTPASAPQEIEPAAGNGETVRPPLAHEIRQYNG